MEKNNQFKNSVMLLVDAQQGVLQSTWNSAEIIDNLNKAIEKARVHNIPLIWIRHSDENLVKNSEVWQIDSRLDYNINDRIIEKKYNSAFAQTELDEVLDELQCDNIILLGAATNWCIRATAYGVLERGFNLTLVEDAHTTESMTLEDGTVIEAKAIIDELNTTFRWLSYPDLKINVSKVSDLF